MRVLSSHLQCSQEVTVEKRKERGQPAPTIDVREQRAKNLDLHLDVTVWSGH